jgi:hypothetical protein
MSTKKCKEQLGKDIYTYLRKTLKLKPKYILFLAEYASNGFNGGKAYELIAKKKDVSRGTAISTASEYLRKPNMLAGLAHIVRNQLKEKTATLERRIIDQLVIRAFYDPSELLDNKGSLKYDSLEDVPVELRQCIDGIETRAYGKDANVSKTIYKLANRDRAREELSKYIKLASMVERREITGKDGKPIAIIKKDVEQLPDEDLDTIINSGENKATEKSSD